MDPNNYGNISTEMKRGLDDLHDEILKIMWEGCNIIEKTLCDSVKLSDNSAEDIQEVLDSFSKSLEKKAESKFDMFEEFSKRTIQHLLKSYEKRLEIIKSKGIKTGIDYGDVEEYNRRLPRNKNLEMLQKEIREECAEHLRLRREKQLIDRQLKDYEKNKQSLETLGKIYSSQRYEEISQFVGNLEEASTPLIQNIRKGRITKRDSFPNYFSIDGLNSSRSSPQNKNLFGGNTFLNSEEFDQGRIVNNQSSTSTGGTDAMDTSDE